MPHKLTKIVSLILCFLFVFQQSGFTQVVGELDISSHILALRNTFVQDKFRPLHLRYLSYDPTANNFNLLLDKGDYLKGLSPQQAITNDGKGTVPEEKLRQETKTLLNYFFIGISLPNESFWVNLRPDAEDNIIDPELAKTDVGKILLEADLQLKKDTAQFTSPQTPEGREYWDKLYKKAEEIYGNENITIPTLTRPWIVPDEIIIRESKDNAYIYKATLKVMLEQDYLKDSTAYNFKDERSKALNDYSTQLIKELIIPKLTKEVNSAKRYASLRQVYYSLILAQWFKQKFYGKSGLYSYLIDRHNLDGLTSKASWSKTTYFNAYKTSFQQGEYNIKEPVYTPTGQTIRSYMSGGIQLGSQEAVRQIIRSARPISNSSPLFLGNNYIAQGLVKVSGTVNDPYGIEKISINAKDQDEPRETAQSATSSLKARELSMSGSWGEFSILDQSIAPLLETDKSLKANFVDLNKLPVGTLVHYEIAGGHWDYTLRIEENGIWLRGDKGRIFCPISAIGNFTLLADNKPSGILEEGKVAYMPYFHQTPFTQGDRSLEYIGKEGFNDDPENISVFLPEEVSVDDLESKSLKTLSSEVAFERERARDRGHFLNLVSLLVLEKHGSNREDMIDGIKESILEQGKRIGTDTAAVENLIAEAEKLKLTEADSNNLKGTIEVLYEKHVAKYAGSPVANESIVDENYKKILSPDFINVLFKESIGGNAGLNRAAVNGLVDSSGKIVVFGNLQNFSPEIKEGYHGGKYYDFTILVTFGKGFGNGITEYTLFVDSEPLLGTPMPADTRAVLQSSIDKTNQKITIAAGSPPVSSNVEVASPIVQGTISMWKKLLFLSVSVCSLLLAPGLINKSDAQIMMGVCIEKIDPAIKEPVEFQESRRQLETKTAIRIRGYEKYSFNELVERGIYDKDSFAFFEIHKRYVEGKLSAKEKALCSKLDPRTVFDDAINRGDIYIFVLQKVASMRNRIAFNYLISLAQQGKADAAREIWVLLRQEALRDSLLVNPMKQGDVYPINSVIDLLPLNNARRYTHPLAKIIIQVLSVRGIDPRSKEELLVKFRDSFKRALTKRQVNNPETNEIVSKAVDLLGKESSNLRKEVRRRYKQPAKDDLAFIFSIPEIVDALVTAYKNMTARNEVIDFDLLVAVALQEILDKDAASYLKWGGELELDHRSAGMWGADRFFNYADELKTQGYLRSEFGKGKNYEVNGSFTNEKKHTFTGGKFITLADAFEAIGSLLIQDYFDRVIIGLKRMGFNPYKVSPDDRKVLTYMAYCGGETQFKTKIIGRVKGAAVGYTGRLGKEGNIVGATAYLINRLGITAPVKYLKGSSSAIGEENLIAGSPAQSKKTTGIYSSILAFRKMLFQRKQYAHLNDIIKKLKNTGCHPAVYEQAIDYAINSKDTKMARRAISLLEQKFSTDESNRSVETLMIIATLAEPQIAQYAVTSLKSALAIVPSAKHALFALREVARCPFIEPQIAQYAVTSLKSALVTTTDVELAEVITRELFHLAQERTKSIQGQALISLETALITPGLNPKVYELIAKLFENLIKYTKREIAQEVISFLESARDSKAVELDPIAFKVMGYTLANTGWQRRGLIRRTSIFALEQENPRKRLAIIMQPIEDNNGAFKDIENKGKQFESRGYQVIIARVNGIDALLTALKAATVRRRASVIMIGGHGSRTSIQLGFGGSDPKLTIRDKQLKEKLSTAAGTLEENGVVILDSCSTGKGGELLSNIAQLFADTFPQGFVFASPYPVVAEKGIEMFFDKDNRITAVEFLHAYRPFGYYNSRAERGESTKNLAIARKVLNFQNSPNKQEPAPTGSPASEVAGSSPATRKSTPSPERSMTQTERVLNDFIKKVGSDELILYRFPDGAETLAPRSAWWLKNRQEFSKTVSEFISTIPIELTDYPDGLIDIGQLSAVIWNITDNAYDAIASFYCQTLFSKPPQDYTGIITVSFSIVDAEHGGKDLVITVADNGAGRRSMDSYTKRYFRDIVFGGVGAGLDTVEKVLYPLGGEMRLMFPSENDGTQRTKAILRIPLESLGLAQEPKKDDASSPLGGIDMRNLPQYTKVEKAPSFRDSPLGQARKSYGGDSAFSVPSKAELDKEWAQIENMLNAGIIPSCERLREYLLGCCQGDDLNRQIDKVLACIADILRQEEEKACYTESPLREILVLLESDKPASELKLALNNIKVEEKELVLIGQ